MTFNRPGVLTSTELTQLIRGRAPVVVSSFPGGISDKKQIQPSSFDLSIGNEFFGMFRTALPKRGEPVSELLKRAEYTFTKEDDEEGFLHQNYTYIVPLRESIRLPQGFSAKFSPKSSIGRVDVFVRVLADGVPLYDQVPDGFQGQLYLEINPLSFRVKILPGEMLMQMRLKMGDPRLSAEEIRIRQSDSAIFHTKEGKPLNAYELNGSEHGVYMHVDLDRDIVGFVSRSSANPLLLRKEGEGMHTPEDYWQPISRPSNGALDLEPGRFYLLATKERVRIPGDLSGDIMPYDAAAGEFRTHYAGFFDPGFGAEGGTTGVLEVRGRELPHSLSDGQPICLMVFEQLASVPKPYEGNYTDPRPSLSRYFARRYEVWEK